MWWRLTRFSPKEGSPDYTAETHQLSEPEPLSLLPLTVAIAARSLFINQSLCNLLIEVAKKSVCCGGGGICSTFTLT